MTAPSVPQDVTAILNYYHPDSGHVYRPGTVGEKRRRFSPVETTIKDIRGHKDTFSLDKHGFQVISHGSIETQFDDEATIKDIYYRECSEVVKKVTGASRVVPFSHVVRRQSFEAAKETEKNLPDEARSSGPTTAGWIHVDQSYQGAYDRVISLVPDGAKTLASARWGIINLWRPIKPVTRNPLAMSDANTVDDSELEEVQIIFPTTDMTRNENKENQAPMVDHYKGNPDIGLWQVHPPKEPGKHKWYYASNMQPNEALLLKIFDSKKSGVARRSAHTSFDSDLDHGPERESLEVRMFVIWDDETSE